MSLSERRIGLWFVALRRFDWALSSPTEAYELVKRVAANPPIEQEGEYSQASSAGSS